MSVECPADIFEKFRESYGSSVRPDADGIIFLYEAMEKGLNFTGHAWLHLPDLDDKAFGDWEEFERWCEDIRLNLMWKLVSEEEYYDICENSTPKEHFKSKDAIKHKITSVLCNPNANDTDHVMCVEIESKDERLLLIFNDSDAWSFGYGDSVSVVKSIDELTPEEGFHPLKSNS